MEPVAFEQGGWELADLLPASRGPEYDHIKREFEKAVSRFEASRARLAEEMEEPAFLQIIRDYDDLSITAHRLGAYAELGFAQNTQSGEALTFKRQMDQLLTDVGNRTLFFSLWWKSVSDDAAERLMAKAGDYRYWLESLRLFKPHTLVEREEQIINVKDVNGMNGLITLYEMITNRFQFNLHVDGKEQALNREELSAYFRHPDPKLRAAAYQELYRVYGEHGNELAQIYAYRAQDWHAEQVGLRHYKSPMAARNLANDIPDEATEALLEVCREKAVVFQRYFSQKAKYVGMKKLRRYDLYAPLAAADKTYPFRQAVNTVLTSFAAFSPVVARHARQVFEDKHVDSEVRPGKLGGAFCAGVVPSLSPYVLLNFTGKTRDVSTMAHELGHAIHYMLASDHSVLTVHSVLPLAETASVFAEMILTDKLLKEEHEPAVRREILAAKVDDTYATVMRQAFFVLFERDAHRMIADGKSSEEICAHYLENLRMQFGNAVEISDEFKWEWVSIPHFYNVPFYVYAYSFGQLLSLALYQQYRVQGDSFKPHYLKLLSYGGSEKPERILEEAGINIKSKDFWRGGFDVVEEWIAELEALPAPKPSRATKRGSARPASKKAIARSGRNGRGAVKKKTARH